MDFKPMSAMTSEEIIKNLPRFHLRFEDRITRSGDHVYTATALVIPGELEIRFRVDQATFFLVARMRNVDTSAGRYEVAFPMRVVKGHGTRPDGSEYEWAFAEGYACPKEKSVYLHDFLHGSTLALLNIHADCFAGLIVDRGQMENADGAKVGFFDDLA